MAMADVAASRPAKKRKLCSASNTESTQSNDDLTKDNKCITIIIPDLQDGYRAINNPPSRREKMETAARGSPENNSPAAAEKIPAAEIEEFFSAAEKKIQKQFTDKYNFDVAKDVPLEGRYEWVQIKP